MSDVLLKRIVTRTGVSPMNPRVKWAELSCGHEVFLPRRPRIGSIVVCIRCQWAARDTARPEGAA